MKNSPIFKKIEVIDEKRACIIKCLAKDIELNS